MIRFEDILRLEAEAIYDESSDEMMRNGVERHVFIDDYVLRHTEMDRGFTPLERVGDD